MHKNTIHWLKKQGRSQPLTVQDKNISSMLPHFPVGSLIFPQISFIFFLNLVFRVGGLPTREGPDYAINKNNLIFKLKPASHWKCTFYNIQNTNREK